MVSERTSGERKEKRGRRGSGGQLISGRGRTHVRNRRSAPPGRRAAMGCNDQTCRSNRQCQGAANLEQRPPPPAMPSRVDPGVCRAAAGRRPLILTPTPSGIRVFLPAQFTPSVANKAKKAELHERARVNGQKRCFSAFSQAQPLPPPCGGWRARPRSSFFLVWSLAGAKRRLTLPEGFLLACSRFWVGGCARTRGRAVCLLPGVIASRCNAPADVAHMVVSGSAVCARERSEPGSPRWTRVNAGLPAA